MVKKLLLPVFVAIFFLGGCGPEKREPKPIPGVRKTAAEALAVLRSRSEHTGPMKANGQCVWEYYFEGKKRKENCAVKMWVNPPAEVYLQGDVGFNPRGIVLGSNASEFWLLIKPELSQYSWGKWSEQDTSSGLMVVPKILDETLGIVEVVDEKNWSLSQEGGFDVLTRRNDKGGISKKMYINPRNYLVRKIEYFDVNENALALAELDKFTDVTEDFFVPTVIKIVMYGKAGAEASESITLNLKSVKPDSFTEERRRKIFNKPEPKGYEHIYRIINGHLVEEPR